MSPQARRRLHRVMTPGELRDLANEVTDALYAYTPHPRPIILRTVLDALMVRGDGE